MRPIRYTVRTAFILLFLQFCGQASGQLGFAFNIKKPEEYDDRVLRSEKSDGKFKLPTRFLQNTVTHFNYYFNANGKLNEVLDRAKQANKDDYSRLINFYNYSLNDTRKDSIQLDSITYKSSSGIALHDLRGDWIDNLYLLWGASYYLQQKFDSAYLMFQFINYAFAPKEKDGYYRVIGSGKDGNSALSIVTKEKKSLPKKIFSEPPSRNDAFIWQIRNFLVQDQFAEASSLLVALKSDPAFPRRLVNDLHEVQAWYFYKLKMYDSSATHLVKALSNATNKQERARWEFLAGQLFELARNFKEAEKYYQHSIGHTTDPIMDIYARLGAIRTNLDGGEKTIQKNVEELVKMAKRDRYQDYRDIIYYMAAQMELEGKNVEGALALLKKSTAASTKMEQRNKAFLQLAELSFGKKMYRDASNYYDSINLNDPLLSDSKAIALKKASLHIIAEQADILYRQDSLQRIAAMPDDERKAFVKQLVKQMRKAQGLKDELPRNLNSPFNNNNTAPSNLFGNNDSKGEWYFYNAASKQRGADEFKSKWGNRANVDNWRRSAAILGSMGNFNNQQNNVPSQQPGQGSGGASNEVSYESLYEKLPLTKEQKKVSDDSIQQALFTLGKAYIQEIEDCSAGTPLLERLRKDYPAFASMDEALFNLYYCYSKSGDPRASAIKQLMSEKYAESKFTTIATTGKDPVITKKDQATKTYEEIYDQFIEGKFEEALNRKKIADSTYGNSFWTPQLLYIEAVYYVKQRKDSLAIKSLQNILNNFPNSVLFNKATVLIDVIQRRSQIEEELRNMVVTRATDSTIGRTVNPIVVTTPPPVKPVSDTANKKPSQVVTNPIPVPVKKDTIQTKPGPKPANSSFSYEPASPHYVILVLNKIDPVFVNETKSAFIRYNRDYFSSKNLSTDLFQLDNDNRLLLIASFADMTSAMAYLETTKPKTATEILPWLRGGKYSYFIGTEKNLEILKTNKDLEAYRGFLNQYLPGKF